MTHKQPAFKRILLKLSGEALMGEQKFGLEQKTCEEIALSIKEVADKGVEMGIVVGGGNIFRGNMAEAFGFARTPADQIGMLATTINGLILQQTLTRLGCKSVVLSAFTCGSMVETYAWNRAMRYLEEKYIVIFVGGTGSPYFTTDTAAALRASEIGAGVLLKATKVDGIYDKDPILHKSAIKYDVLTYSEVLTKDLKVMDATAIALCRENKIPVVVFNLFEPGSLLKAVLGESIGTIVNRE